MKAYTDSMEAARTRMTASLEKWTLALDGSKALKVFYNAIADVSDNLVAWSTSIIAMMALTNTAGVGTGIQNGLGKIWSVLANSQISSMNRQETFANYWGKGGMGGVWTRIKENIEGDFLASQKEVFSKSLNATIKNMDALSESAKTMLSDGMVPLQNSMLNLEAAQKAEIGAALKKSELSSLESYSILEGISVDTRNNIIESLLGTVSEQEKNSRLEAIMATNGNNEAEAKLRYASELLADSRNNAARQQIGSALEQSSQMSAKKAGVSGAITGGLTIGGLLLGNTIGESLGGGTGQAVGSLIGMSLGNSLAKQVSASIAALPKNATVMAAVKAGFGGMFTGVGAIITPLLIAAVPLIIAGFVKKAKNKVKEESANLAKEASETYTNTLNASAEAVNFDKLVNGVDYLGRNVSLTDEEYQKFLDSSNALAEAFPELVVRTDELGNKFVGPDGLSGQVGEVTEKIDELTEASRKAADSELFKMKDVKFAGFNVGQKSGFSNVFDEQAKILGEANNTLNYKAKTVYGVDVQGLNQEIALRESTLENIGKNQGTDSDEYKKAKKQLDQLKLDRDALFEDINTAKDALAEYTEQLISYANTANGQAEFEGQFGNIEDQLNDMSDNGKNLVLSSVKLAIRDMEFSDEEDYKNKVLSLTQKAADLLESNPVIADIYYGVGEFKTLGEQQDAMEKMIPVLEEIFGADGYDEAEKAIIEHLGLKIVVDGDKTSIEVESLGEVFAKNFDGFDEGLVTDNTVQNWDDYIGGLSKEKLSQLKKLQSGGWIGAGSVYTPDILNKMLGNGYEYTGYNAGNVQRLVDRAQDYTSNSNLFDDLEQQWSSTDDYGISDFVTKSKTEIAAAFPELDEATWELIYNLQSEIRKGVAETGGQGAKEIAENAIEQVKEAAKGSWLNDVKEQLAVQAETFFPDVSSIEGAIDTWGELSAAMKNVSETYDTLADATKENNTLGHLSAQTVVDLISENENYATAMDVVDGKIKLNSDAERIMNEIKIETLKASIDAMIAENTAKIEQLKTQYESVAANGTYVESVNDVVDAYNLELQAATELTNELHRQNMEKEGLDSSGYAGREANIVKGRVVAVTDVDAKLTEIDSQIKSLEHQNEILSNLRGQLDTVTDAKSWGKMYNNLDTTSKKSKDAADSVEKMLKALDSLIDKEWEAMEVWDEYNQKSTGYTAYFDKKRISLEKQAEFYKSQMKNASTEEERLDAEKDYILAQKEINNLDDEEIEDKYNILELQGASLDKLIAMQKVYIQTSDTEEENLERNKKLVELLHQQVELHREVSEWQRDNTDRLLDRLSGDAYGNETYDRAISQQIDAVNDEMADTQKQIQMYYAEAIKGYEQSGSTHAEALRLAYTGNSDASQSLRDEMTKYYDLIDKRTEYTIKKMEDKADDLNRRLDLIEKEKPQEWFKIGDIDSYYTQRMDLLQKQVELYQDALKDTSDMTDEQIQNIVDSLNEATLNLKEAQIDNLKDQTDLQSKQYDAIVYRINLWKDEIQDAIDAIEDAYEDEIKPIEDINDALERQGKLEDLLAAKKAREKEKERVFRQRIGWVFFVRPRWTISVKSQRWLRPSKDFDKYA